MRGYDILTAVGAAVALMGATVVEITLIPVVAGIIVAFAGLIIGERVETHEKKARHDRIVARRKRMSKRINFRVSK